jgi:hypothetical protein
LDVTTKELLAPGGSPYATEVSCDISCLDNKPVVVSDGTGSFASIGTADTIIVKKAHKTIMLFNICFVMNP